MDNNNNKDNGNNDHWPEPRKLNDGMIKALSEYIAKGNYAVTACQLCGIDDSTFYLWGKQGVRDMSKGFDTIYTRLIRSLKEAEGQAEAKMVQLARDCAEQKKDGYLAITVLERRHPTRWGRRDRIEHTGEGGGPIQITGFIYTGISNEELGMGGEIVEGEVKASIPQLEEGKEDG